MRLLVCGSRDYADRARLNGVLDLFHERRPVGIVIEGEAPGADTMAREWAEARGIQVERYPADWTKYGKSAGPIRNRQMLDEGRPDAVIAFPLPSLAESRGTRNMVEQAIAAGVAVRVVEP